MNKLKFIFVTILLFLNQWKGYTQTISPRLGWQSPIGSIDAYRFSPDDKLLVTASYEVINVYDVETRRVIYTLESQGQVTDIRVSKNNKLLAITGEVGLSIWDMATGKKLTQLNDGYRYGYSLEFDLSETRLISRERGQYYNPRVSVWDTKLWQKISDFEGNARWSPDGKKILITSKEQDTIRLADAATGKLHWTKVREREDYYFERTKFSTDGTKIIILNRMRRLNGDSIRNDEIDILSTNSGARLIRYVTPQEEIHNFVNSFNDIVTISDSSIWCRDLLSDKMQPLIGHTDQIDQVEFSSDGTYFVTSSSREGKIILWNSKTKQMVAQLVGYRPIFSSNGRTIATSNNSVINFWSTETGAKLNSISSKSQSVLGVLQLDANSILCILKNRIDVLDLESGKLLNSYSVDSGFSVENFVGGQIITGVKGGVQIRDARKGVIINEIKESSIYGLKSNKTGTMLAMKIANYPSNIIRIRDITKNTILDLSGHSKYSRINSFEFSDSGDLLLSSSSDSTAIVWDVSTGLRKTLLFMDESEILTATFTNDDSLVATLSKSHFIRLFDTKSGNVITSVNHLGAKGLSYHSGTKRLASYTDHEIKIWKIPSLKLEKIPSLKLEKTLPQSDEWVRIPKFSQDGRYILSDNGSIWEIESGKMIRSSDSEFGLQHGPKLSFSLDDKLAFGSLNVKNATIIETRTGKTLLNRSLTDSTDWVVTHPSGLFDASPAAMDKLYFVQGFDIIEFNQLKERYYEPGLWKKVMSGEKLRSVVGMKSIELPPDIRVGQVDEKGYLPIELVNKGGGIGEVTILINGKEAIADARPKGSNSKTDKLSLNVYIGNNKALIKGSDNFIAVKAWNEGHWVVSRAAGITYAIEGNEKAYKPAIHIITSGVSDYTGTELDLKYAAKDAEDVSKALQLGAKKLFGTERSYIYNLTTSQSTNQYPTKANILKTFEKVSSVAHPLDVVVVYLSGHGINHGGQDGDWYYLTHDAYTSSSSAYNDPEIRRTSTVSSNELVELFKKVPALKQVLMIDACASGKVVENLMAKKDIESTTLRALDRMRDRTGLHIITGCTADAVSYEASKYGQGVLTYSLLEGIRGAALREDQFVDINKLFQYAHDRVPTLAEGIGGIQTPQVFSPQGGQSFDIGVLGDIEKKEIPIAKIRPVYIRSAFIDDDQLEDALQLGKKIDDALNEAASKGTGSSIIFVDVRDYPEGCKLSGKYKLEGGIIKLKLRKKCEGKDETIEVQGNTVEEVRGKILSSL